ncbi:MAG TPA: alkaline phosphatase family protein, partial [Candidatus Cybelea sp.]
LLIVSPYAKAGCVSHVRYEHGSILKFIEDQWNLPRLSASDTRANPIAAGCFDFGRPPRTFTTIPSSHGVQELLRQPPDPRPPDTE